MAHRQDRFRWERRERKQRKQAFGMRVSGRSVFLLEEKQRRKTSRRPQKRGL